MHQYRVRPAIDDAGQIVPQNTVDLPFLDCYVIKLFALEHPNSKHRPHSAEAQAVFDAAFSSTTPLNDPRGGLADLSKQTLEFLARLSTLSDPYQVAGLLAWKTHILTTLQSWENTYSSNAKHFMDGKCPTEVRFYATFSPLLHRVLKVVVSLTMSSSAADMDVLEADFRVLRDISKFLTETKKRNIKRAEK